MSQRVPAFANCHSHAFHRALRARPVGGDTFWGWRDGMYRVADVLDPDLYCRLARATYAEMRLAGYASVGEFHYLHHGPDGVPYADPNAMGEALIAAAADAGIRLCLLDTCYLRAGFDGAPLGGAQTRFADASAEAWRDRVTALAAAHPPTDRLVIGAAIHSVRAVGPADLATVVAALPAAPLHVHTAEQPAEVEACLAATGRTPVALLAEAGVWSGRTTAVHATHLTAADSATLGAAGAFACFCPTTEADLGDGIGPSLELAAAGVRLTLGSDSHAAIDPWDEARALARHARLATGRRDGWDTAALWRAATSDGHASLGLPAGDTVEVTLSPRTAGAADPLWAATAADVTPPAGLDPGQVAADLAAAIDAIWGRL
jgi:formiminoglutamate deiminase